MTTLGIIWLTCLLWMTVSLIFYRPRKMGGMFDQNLIKDRTKTNFNLIALYFNLRNGELIDKDFLTRFKPLTPLQKEIEEEERTIKEIEQQIADINRLDDLKRKKNRLFGELGEADYKTRTGNSTETEKHVIAFVDGMKLPHAFANERKAIEHIEKYYPRGIEIEWKEVGL